ncbi:MAG TPA: LytS/YhcK type 5TM receptor domain-containing protein [Methylomirabilota bacterium]|nr:LytS/YhcK type 5TM receptor domain-containing protein [Methylomirabilota bacterium]
MTAHHSLEAVGILVLGLLFYSYTIGWVPGPRPADRLRRTLLHGLGFGALTVATMIARIEIAPGIYIDPRAVPVALIGLFEGWPPALLAAAMGCAYRLLIGGDGMWAGVFSLLGTAAVAGLVHVWVRHDGGLRPRHVIGLTAASYVVTFLGFSMLGAWGLALFSRVWTGYAITFAIGIGLVARLFYDVAEQHRLTGEQGRFRAVLDEAADAIRIIDCDSQRIVDVNRADCSLSGYTREELVGRLRRDFWPEGPEFRLAQEASLAETYAAGFLETRGSPFRTRGGAVVPVDTTQRIVEFEGRRYEIVMWHEAGPRIAAETADRETAELRAATLLARAAAHEINNPLAVVLGYLQLMGSRMAPETKEAGWIRQMTDACGRIRDAVGRFNSITKIEATTPIGGAPPMLDTARSSVPAAAVPEPPTPSRPPPP